MMGQGGFSLMLEITAYAVLVSCKSGVWSMRASKCRHIPDLDTQRRSHHLAQSETADQHEYKS